MLTSPCSRHSTISGTDSPVRWSSPKVTAVRKVLQIGRFLGCERRYRFAEAVALPKLVRYEGKTRSIEEAKRVLWARVEPKYAQDRLGHADISVTLNTYTHVLPEARASVAKKIE